MKNNLRDFRESNLMTQRDLARKSKVSLRTISNIERGHDCRPTTKRKLLEGMGMEFKHRLLVFPRP